MSKFITFGLCLFFLFTGCAKKEGKILARIGRQKITLQDFEKRLTSLPMEYQQYLRSPEVKKRLLDSYIQERLILESAERDGFLKNREISQELKQRIEVFKDSFIIEKYIEQLRKKQLAVRDDELKNYYDKNYSLFAESQEIQVSHILLSTEDEAKTVLEKIKKGADFAQLAKQYSNDPGSASRGGDLGYIKHGELVPEFENAAFGLKKGEISGIVKTEFGYHLIKRVNERKISPRTLEEVTPQIRRILEKEKFDTWLAEIRNKIPVKVNAEILQ